MQLIADHAEPLPGPQAPNRRQDRMHHETAPAPALREASRRRIAVVEPHATEWRRPSTKGLAIRTAELGRNPLHRETQRCPTRAQPAKPWQHPMPSGDLVPTGHRSALARIAAARRPCTVSARPGTFALFAPLLRFLRSLLLHRPPATEPHAKRRGAEPGRASSEPSHEPTAEVHAPERPPKPALPAASGSPRLSPPAPIFARAAGTRHADPSQHPLHREGLCLRPPRRSGLIPRLLPHRQGNETPKLL